MKIHNNLKPKAAGGMSKAASGGLVGGGEHRPIRSGIGTHREQGVPLVFSRSLEDFYFSLNLLSNLFLAARLCRYFNKF